MDIEEFEIEDAGKKIIKVMKIEKIFTKRFFTNWRSMHLVFEWEDIFKRELNASFMMDFDNGLHGKIGFLYDRIPISDLWHYPTFVYEMFPACIPTRENNYSLRHNNNSSVVPCIIDWYLRTDGELRAFVKAYSKHKIVFVSSMEVYQYLKSIDIPIQIGHLPLSLSDKYKVSPDSKFDKDLDVVLMGRQNPVLLDWLYRYKESHPHLTIVSSEREKNDYKFYTSEGKFVAKAEGRAECMELISRSKISFFSTKGMDGDWKRTNGFSQVTPRLFEFMATGNHVIARYEDNPDTEFYELNSICPHTSSYESFCRQMDDALEAPVDMPAYSAYLSKHYTSNRVEKLVESVKSL